MIRKIQIKSVFTGERWQGELELPEDDQEALTRISRLFSRVNEEDITRLEEIGYRLPSISVGDRVDLDNERYWANDVGWTSAWIEIPAYARMISSMKPGGER